MLLVLIIVIVCRHSDSRVDVSYCSHDRGLIILVEIIFVEVGVKKARVLELLTLISFVVSVLLFIFFSCYSSFILIIIIVICGL